MNRWQGWARQLRRRHGRRDVRPAHAAMVLRQPGGLAPMVLVTSWRPLVQVHARFELRGPASALALQREFRSTPVFPPALRSRFGPAFQAARPSHPEAVLRRPGYPAAAASALVLAATSKGIAPLQLARHLPGSAPQAARRPQLLSSAAVHAGELAARVRGHGFREELRLSPKPAVLAVAQRAATPAVVNRAEEMMAPKNPAGIWPGEQRAPAPAAVNVDALTGLVIQQLDRRLIAYRERMGRA